MYRNLLAVFMLAVSLLATWPGIAQDQPAPPAQNKASALTLPPTLRSALLAEMAGLKAGMAELSASLASGQWDKTAERAARIRDSYIMKQKLSRAELEQLERSLPADFVVMDQRFHRHAEGLAHAAHMRDHELAVFYFSRMLESCGSCHARYATHTFPGFRRAEPAPHAH